MLTLYCRLVDAFFGIASGAFAAAVPDLVGDFLIEVRPVLAGARGSSTV